MNCRWRRILFRSWSIILLVFSFSITINAQKKWDGGGGDSLWENPLNWSDNATPISSDDILLDNSIVVGNYEVIISGSEALPIADPFLFLRRSQSYQADHSCPTCSPLH
jgi:hypothetical protein